MVCQSAKGAKPDFLSLPTAIVRILMFILLAQAEIAFGRPLFLPLHARHESQGINQSLHHAEANFQRRHRAGSQPDSPEQASQSNVEDDDDLPDHGPWVVSVPSIYQSQGYGLRLRRQYVPLNVSHITLTGRDSPEFVSLIDPNGRVLQRRKAVVNQHVFSGFRNRHYRISSWFGASKLLGKGVDSGGLPSAVSQIGIEGIYQPGPIGYAIGLDFQNGQFASKTSPTEQRLKLGATDLRIGGVFEWGLLPRSTHYRWHGLAHGGLLFGTMSLTPVSDESQAGERTQTSKPANSATVASNVSGSSKGVYGALDLLHMWQNWWWGGRAMINQKLVQSSAKELSGSVTSVGLELIGSYTF